MRIIITSILYTFSCLIFAQTNIKGIVLDEIGNGIKEAQIISEWVEKGQIKRAFANTFEDGSFVIVSVLPSKLMIESTNYQSQIKNLSDSSFLQIKLKFASSMNAIQPILLKGVRQNVSQTSECTLSKKEIGMRNSSADIPSLILLQPSVTTTSDAGNAVGYSGIRIRGTDATRINVTVNGIPINDAESQGVWWVNMPDIASSLNSLQISRGLGSSTNGTSSFGGAVSLETDDPSKANSRLDLAYGSFNTYRTTAVLNSGRFGSFAAGLRISNVKSNGYIERAASDLQSQMFNLSYIGKKNSLRFIQFGGKEKTYQSWYGVTSDLINQNRRTNIAGQYLDKNGNTQYYDNQTDNYSQSHYQLLFDQHIATFDKWNLDGSIGLHYTKGVGYYEEYKENQYLPTYQVVDSNNSNLVRQLWLLNDFMGSVYSLNLKSNEFNITLGGGLNTYFGNHFGKIINATLSQNIDFNKRFYDSDSKKQEWSNFIKVKHSFVKKASYYQTFADIQVRQITYTANGVNDNQSLIDFRHNYTFFNPKIGISKSTRKRNFSHKTGLFAGMGNREPVRSDFLLQGKIPKLERLLNVEIAYTISRNKWALITNYYWMYYQNQLVLTGELDNVGASIRENVKQSYRTGLELILQYEINKKWNVNANVTLAKSAIKQWKETVYDYDNGKDSQLLWSNKSIAYSPNFISGLMVQHKLDAKTDITFQNKIVGRQFLDNTQSIEKSIDAFTTFDVFVHRKINLMKITKTNMPFNLTLYLNNITNAKYSNNGWSYNYLTSNGYASIIAFYPQARFNGSLKISFIF